MSFRIFQSRTSVASLGLLAGLLTAAPALGDVTLSWNDPGWAYEYRAESASAGTGGIEALDGTWDHRGGDSWDGSALGGVLGSGNAPGGISALNETEGSRTTTFVRLQDPGDPRDYTYDGVTAYPDECNRRLRLTHNMADEGATDTTLDDGVTITFRARLATLATGPLDPQYPDTASGAEAGTPGADWPATGNGSINHADGRGIFTIRSKLKKNISFSLALPSDHNLAGVGSALLTNNLNGTKATTAVDTGEAGTAQYVPISDLTAWHEFWITIIADTSGGGTHRVEVYMDGSLNPTVLHVTAGSASVEQSGLENVLALGPSITGQMAAVDVDFFAWKAGVTAPEAITTCAFRVTPAEEQSFETDINQQPSPASVDFQVMNIKPDPFNYTVVELDENQNQADVSWLSLSKTSGGLTQGVVDTVTATVNAAGLADGSYTAYLKFVNTCNPAGNAVRQINLNVIGCRWTVDSCNAQRSYLQDYPNAPISDVTYTLANQGATPVTYNVSVQYGNPGAIDWLTLTGATGTVGPAGTCQVVAKVDASKFAAAAADQVYDATLTFSAPCSRQTVTRTILVRSVPAGATHVWMYDGDKDPTTADSAGPGLSFGFVNESPISTNQGVVARDPAAHDRVAWHLEDAADKKTKFCGIANNGSEWAEPTVYGEVGATVVGRLRVVGASNRELMLGIFDGSSLFSSFHWGGTDGMVMETKRGAEATFTGTTDYVVARMTAVGLTTTGHECSRLIRIYMNENPAPVMELVTPSTVTVSSEGIGFGAGSTGGTADIWFDWVSGTNAGAFAPGEEIAVIGKSLIPEGSCPDPFADTDGDQDVDQADFGVWQLCYTGAGQVIADPTRCDCLDIDHNDRIDLADLDAFVSCFRGPAIQASTSCDD